MTSPPRHAEPNDELFRNTSQDARAEQDSAEGSIFDNPGPGSSVPSTQPVYEVSEDLAADEAVDDDEAPPRTATEAFLRSAHIDHGDPPLPPLDDADVGARYARDAMRATAQARSRRDEDTLDVTPDAEPDGDPDPDGVRDEVVERDSGGDEAATSGKPLGWLFRSSS